MDNNQSKKDKIQVGEICYFDPTQPKKLKTIKSEPIYKDWTPELQAAQDKMIDDFAKLITSDLLEYGRTGGDMNNLAPSVVYSHLDQINKQQKDKSKQQRELEEKKKDIKTAKLKIIDEEILEFLEWKKFKGKTIK